MLKHIPNILTVSRFFLIPFEIYFMVNEQYLVAIFIIILSALTDVLDGIIARKFNIITNFGKLIDPLADKFTQLSLLFTLVYKNIIPLWILIVLLIKEFALIIGASFLYGKDLVVSSKWYGKASTVIFYIAIVLSLILNQFKGIILARQLDLMNLGKIPFTSAPPLILYMDRPLYYLAVLMAIFSLGMYFKAFYIQGYLKEQI